MLKTEIKNLKKGEFIKLSENSSKVYLKGDYDRSSKSFSCIEYEDINHEVFVKACKPVFYGFTY